MGRLAEGNCKPESHAASSRSRVWASPNAVRVTLCSEWSAPSSDFASPPLRSNIRRAEKTGWEARGRFSSDSLHPAGGRGLRERGTARAPSDHGRESPRSGARRSGAVGSSELEPSNSGRARSHLEVLKDNGEGLWATRAGRFKFRGDVCARGGPGLRASGFGFLSPADQRRTRGRMQCTCASGVGHWWLGFACTWWAISSFQLQPVGWFGRWVATGEG